MAELRRLEGEEEERGGGRGGGGGEEKEEEEEVKEKEGEEEEEEASQGEIAKLSIKKEKLHFCQCFLTQGKGEKLFYFPVTFSIEQKKKYKKVNIPWPSTQFCLEEQHKERKGQLCFFPRRREENS